uniref:Ig-like domain-containing protein n=1 Tax=Labrus bergylta TaxID=56723 RepID=A0A3Q3FDP0_9LABR
MRICLEQRVAARSVAGSSWRVSLSSVWRRGLFWKGKPVDLLTDSQYTGRVTYSSKSKDCTLTITNVGNSDSAVYKFRFITNHQDGSYTGDPGVTLSLTDLQVKVGTSRYSSSWADLTCVSSCTLPPHSSYIWFKNGEKIPRKTSSTYSDYFEYADSYSCALQEHQDFPSPPVVTYYAPKLPSVSVSPSAEIVEGSSVTLTCSSHANPAAKYTWFKENLLKGQGQSYYFPSISPEHSGHYICIVQNTRGRHNSTVHLTVLEGNTLWLTLTAAVQPRGKTTPHIT